MKRELYKSSLWSLLVMMVVCMGACKKNDSEYYDYKNTAQTFKGSALDYLKSQPNTFDSLLLVLERYPFLKDSLSNQKLTLFAPVNENFAAAFKYLNRIRKAAGKPDVNIKNADFEELGIMVCKYILRGNRTTEAYVNSVDGLSFNTIILNYPMHIKAVKSSTSGFIGGGATALEYSDTFGSIFQGDWVTTKTNAVNINTDNATINVLSPLHNFGFNEFTIRLDK